MRLPLHAIAICLGAALAVGAASQAAPRQHASGGEAVAPRPPMPQTIAYGSDPAQQLDLWRPAQARAPVPLVLFVHGGGWQHGSRKNATGQWKPAHYPAEGYAFASIDYRLVPDATVEQQAKDVAAALHALIDRAAALGIDRHRIVLMGHSAGAHLVALVGTDPRYLAEAGLSLRDLSGVIPIDGAAYDVPAQMTEARRIMQRIYRTAFGTDAARQRALSPTLHAAAPNAPRFLLLHVQRADGVRQAQGLAAALRTAGSEVTIESVPGKGLAGHREINQRLGDPTYPATITVDRWLARAFAR